MMKFWEFGSLIILATLAQSSFGFQASTTLGLRAPGSQLISPRGPATPCMTRRFSGLRSLRAEEDSEDLPSGTSAASRSAAAEKILRLSHPQWDLPALSSGALDAPPPLNSSLTTGIASLLTEDSWLNVALSRLMDTVSDVGIILTNMQQAASAKSVPREQNGQPCPPKLPCNLIRVGCAKELNQRHEPGRKEQVVVIGTGWGAHAAIKLLDPIRTEVVCISPRSYFIFTPMVASSAVGTVEYRSITEPIRFCSGNLNFYEATVVDVDVQKNEVLCQTTTDKRTFTVPYDKLILSFGTKSATFGTPGVRENCYFLKDVNDARALRAGIVECFEEASLPDVSVDRKREILGFVVVGGGPTGVEFAGELFDFLRQDVSRFYPDLVPYVSATLVQAGDAVLPTFPDTLRQSALKTLRGEGTDVLLNTKVLEVNKGEIRIQRKPLTPDEQTDVESLKYGLCVWAAGNGPNELAEKLVDKYQPFNTGRAKRIQTDDWLRMLGNEKGNVFAIGDCSASESLPLPQTAQVAAQQGAYLARLINRGMKAAGNELDEAYGSSIASHVRTEAKAGNPLAQALVDSKRMVAKPFQFLSLGALAYTGGRTAVADMEIDLPQGTSQVTPGKTSNNPISGSQMIMARPSGWAGFALWRSVYITKQVATRNRILVLFDWFSARLFGRDIANK